MSNASAVRASALILALSTCLLCPQTGGRAGSITFNDLSDDVTVVDTTGRITSSVCDTEHCFVTFSAPLNTVNVSGSPPNINIRESPGGRISDVLFVNSGPSAAMIEFVSDVEGFVLDPVPGVFIVETGTIQNVASVTWTLRDGSTVVDSIGFISDVSEVSEVPEPRGIALLGIGLLGLGLIRRQAIGRALLGCRGESRCRADCGSFGHSIGGIGNRPELSHGVRRSVFP
jgi:hypothetical protein